MISWIYIVEFLHPKNSVAETPFSRLTLFLVLQTIRESYCSLQRDRKKEESFNESCEYQLYYMRAYYVLHTCNCNDMKRKQEN